MIQEFKEFINRGNLIDLAVAFVLGTAFATLVAVFIETMIDPLLGYITPGDNLASWTAGPFLVGAFILGIIAFLAIALVIFFVVKAYNRMNPPQEVVEAEDETVVLLREIRDSLNR